MLHKGRGPPPRNRGPPDPNNAILKDRNGDAFMDTLSGIIKQTLSELHIPSRLHGYGYLAYNIEQVVIDPQRIQGVTKDLYRETARRHGTTWQAVEHADRTAINACWERGGREKLDEVVGYHLVERPWATEFIVLVADHIRRVHLQ